MDQSPSRSTSLAVRLVVGAGTHAGVTADIREGLYMIGRDRECQIRPKSHSVSDRHCVVHHQSGTVRVYDLDSEEGTFINDEPLEPKKWYVLNHGDQLRCGRYWFDVTINLSDDNPELAPSDSSEVDIGEEETDLRESQSTSEQAQVVELFDDDDFELQDMNQSSRVAGVTCDDTIDEDSVGEADHQERNPSKKKSRPKRPSRLPKPKLSRSTSSGSSLSLPEISWKVVGACLLTLVVLCYAGWTAFKIQKGAPVKIVEGID